MTDLTHPLTPWSHAECVDLIRQQIDRNTRERDRKIVAMYLTGASSQDVGDHFGVSRSAILAIVRKFDDDLIRPNSYRRKGGEAAAD